jgi:sigma-54 dependent transcriptional regulator, acetoin dehydrogenase operon transcriptional activator AcoR
VSARWDELHQSIATVRNGWLTFQRGLPADGIRLPIQHSWERSRAAGINPGQTGGLSVWGDHDLVEARSRHQELLAAATPTLHDLRHLLIGTGQVVALFDPQARALMVEGDREARRAAEGINLVPGSDWSEVASGTNAMGTAAALQGRVTVFASEHFLENLHPWACVAAPIRHPVTGEVLGILDLSGVCMSVSAHTEMAVAGAVSAIEARVGLLEVTFRHALLEAYSDRLATGRQACVGVLDRRGVLLRCSGPGLLRLDLARYAGAGETEVELDGLRLRFQPVRFGETVIGSLVEAASGAGRQAPPKPAAPLDGLIGRNPTWLAALDRAARAARTDSTVLITGETGTGKEVLARAIHRASGRVRGPFIAVNCGALPPNLAASELFGYAPGAFTGANPRGRQGAVEAAGSGTLFLDEVGDLPPEAQVALLRVLQEREVVRVGSHQPLPVDVRVIAATNRDLTAMAARGEFRQDLFFRLNVVPLAPPPLRERREDILPLVEHAYRRLWVEPPNLGLASCDRLTSYPWPGNVRELFNLVEQAVALDEDPAALLPLPPLSTAAGQERHLGEPDEEERIRHALEAAGGNAAAAARGLGISRTTLYRKLELYGIRLGRQVQ